MRWLRVLAMVLAIPVVLLLLAVVVSVVMSPPGGGRRLAEDLRVPHRAVIAHRGASYRAPEATMPAYLLAREMDVDYLEADLQRTADGVIVVFHDDTLADKTNVAEVFPGRENDFIETFTYDELMQLDAGSWFNEAFPELARPSFEGLRILTLQELMDIAAAVEDGPGLYLETKAADRHAGYEAEIVRRLREAGFIAEPDGDVAANSPGVGTASPAADRRRAPVIFQSFYPESLAELKRLAPEVPRVLLISTEIEAEHGWDNLLDVARAEAHAVGPIGFLAWPWNVGPAHRAGLLVHPYTINLPWQMQLLSFFGADGFFTDVPEVALQVYGGRDSVDVEALFDRIGY